MKDKLRKYLLQNDTSLQDLFTFMDKDKSDSLTIGELTTKMKNILDDNECLTLFQALDQDNSSTITRDELISECSKIHASYVLQRLKNAIESGKTKIQDIFKAVDSNGNGEMEIHEFNEAIGLLYSNLDKYEVDALFKHFDTQGLGHITVDQFKRALSNEMSLENKLIFIMHDFMTPLKTLITHQYKIAPSGLFDRFSKDKKVITPNDFR